MVGFRFVLIPYRRWLTHFQCGFIVRRLRIPHCASTLGTAIQTRASISRFRSFAAPTFPPVLERRVHRVYSDTADSSVTPPNSHAPCFRQSARDHVLITRCLRFHWFLSATPLFLIGNMLPPARALWILFLFFFCCFLRFWFTQLRLDLAVKKVVRLMCPGFAQRSCHPVFPSRLCFWEIYACWILTPAG